MSTDEPDEDVAAVAGQLGRFLILNGQADEAAPHLERSLELAEALALPEVFVDTLTSKGVLLIRRDRLEECRMVLEGAHAYALAHDLPTAVPRTANNLAVAYESSDRYLDAVELTASALQFARRVGDRNWELQMLAGPVSSLALLGRWDQAVAQASEAEGLPGAEGVSNQGIFTVAIDCWRGRSAEARAHLEQFTDLSESEDVQTWVAYELHQAMVLRVEGKPLEALERLEPVVGLRETLGMTYLLQKIGFAESLEAAFAAGQVEKLHELLGIIDRLRPGERPPMLAAHAARFRAKSSPDSREAETDFAQAEKQFRELGMTYWLAVTQLEHAEWLVDRNRASAAAPLIGDARATFEQLDAQAWLDRLGVIETEQLATAPAAEPTPA